MRKRVAICAVVTLVVARILYALKPVTFAIWTNAAMVSHSHPFIAVSVIEGIVVGLVFTASWIATELLTR